MKGGNINPKLRNAKPSRIRSELSKITSFLKSGRDISNPHETENITGDVDVDTVVHTSDELPRSSFTSTDTTSIYPQVSISRANSEETAVVENPCDIDLWTSNMNDRFRDYWLEKGSKECRYVNSNFEKSAVTKNNRTCHCTPSLFARKHLLTDEKT